MKLKNSWINARMQRRTYLSSEEIYRFLEEDAEEWSADGSESSDDGEEDHVNENAVSDSSEEETIDIPSIRSPNSFVSRKGNEIRSCDPLTSATGRAAAHNVFQENAGPSRFANSQCGLVLDSFLLKMYSLLLETIRNWTNIEGEHVYESYWKALDQKEFMKYLGVMSLIGVHKCRNENTSQLWSKEDERPTIFSEKMSRESTNNLFRVLLFHDANTQKNKRNDQLQPIRDAFEKGDSFLRDSYVSGINMTVDE